MANEKQTIWTKLMGGQLPSMDINTAVTLDQNSVMKAGAILFIVAVLITVAYFTIRKKLA